MAYPKLATNTENIPASEFFDILLDHSQNMIFVKDEQFRILYANRAFLNMYAPEIRNKLIGTTTIENFSEEEATVFLREDQKAFEQGSAQLIEELTDYLGVKRTYQTHKIRFTDKRGRVLMLGVCNDITKWAEREKALAQSNLALENFAAVAAHDLRSPLGSFLSGLEVISIDKDNRLSPESSHIIEMMKHSGEGLVAQISNLMDAYKTSSSGSLDLSSIDVGVLIEEVKFNLGRDIQMHDVTIRCSSLPVIKSDKHFFRQLLHNLIENSIKYRAAEKPIIIVRYEKIRNEHIFSIEDNGIGIHSGRGKVFKLFEQSDPSVEGIGLGLSLCKKIVELHGGTIWIDTTYKAGCKICFAIPV